MVENRRKERGVAICLLCDSALSVRVDDDGNIQPIAGGSCACGGSEFRLVDEKDIEEG